NLKVTSKKSYFLKILFTHSLPQNHIFLPITSTLKPINPPLPIPTSLTPFFHSNYKPFLQSLALSSTPLTIPNIASPH
ncbi:hypothetical protein, partial [Staphylococcus epidermidis]|uniref:hypothetical protein n=1 Tax=Staphylococcus epidermidis TaxID=1282 RepID=UPI001C935B98